MTRNLGIRPCTVDKLRTTNRYTGTMSPLLVLSRPETVSVISRTIRRTSKSLKISIREVSFHLYSLLPSTPRLALRRRLRWWLDDDNQWRIPLEGFILKTVIKSRQIYTASVVPHLFFLPSERFPHYLQQSRWFRDGR